ncbi:hypothetical protein [Treponema bryantii]|uniref:hypothetical protein n=1 Tax=Treponema bryantii TaxID=163 RepID=UPI0003B4D9F3|nr:hypothetical protein [Treponema bryantii]
MSNGNEEIPSFKEIIIPMQCISFSIAFLLIDAELPEDFDKSFLYKVMDLVHACISEPSGIYKMLDNAKLLKEEISDYPVKESCKEFFFSTLQTFDEIL